MKNRILLILFVVIVNTIYAQDYKYGKVSKEEVLELSHPTNPEANAAFLFKSSNTYYDYKKDRGFVLTTDVHERIKIYNQDGFDWATKEISLYNSGSDKEEVVGIRGETYNIEEGELISQKLSKDGIFDVEVNKYRSKEKITMPALKEGSVIEYKYTIISPFIFTVDKMELQNTIPIKRLETQIIIPEYFIFQKHSNPKSPLTFKIQESQKNTSHTNTSIERKGWNVISHSRSTSKLEYRENIYRIEEENIPALKKEEYVDYLKNYAAFLSWELLYTKFPSGAIENYSETWEDVVNKIYNNSEFGQELSITKYFDDDLDEVLKGKSIPKDKMNIIFQFVKDKVKWNDYVGYYSENGVRDAYKEGNGNIADINLMLTSMLKYAGLDANPILISTKDNGIPIYPSRTGFNYVVASVKLNNKIIILDASQKYNNPGMLSEHARNWMGRLVREDGSSEWVDLMGKEVSEYRTNLRVQIEDDLTIKGKVTNILDGYYAKEFREEKNNLGGENYIQQLEEDKGDIKISNIETKNKEILDQDIRESYDFDLNNGIEKIGNNLYLKPLFFLTKDSNPFKSDERNYPIFFKYPSIVSNTVHVKIPDAYEVESMPENQIITVNNDGAVFKLIVAATGKYLKIDSEFKINTVIYLPEEYETLKNFYSSMIEKNLETIVLKKTS
ncbi:uncharacterized protein DUF3857 [Gillisia mitskevichiae]|uniref:Uncharacterized protein DUF3857 n=1 Tax=Gillisia mitskevichiae TaxID=270921 RepID=A0A495Q015_9FLAO|nr:DUF3857 domain-containing protein [Gillisia mitskevichiae]RKS56140.1 uncharacterized protein DUF3857 [Gillisia mitskevichiae]